MKKKIIVLAVAVLVAVLYVNAQQDSAALFSKAMQLLDTMKMEQSYTRTIDLLLDQQINQNPSLKVYRKEMQQFFVKYMGWESIKKDFAAIYAQYYTMEDFDALITFYSSPTGQKALAHLPEITQKGMLLGQQKVQAHLDELKKIIEKASEKAEHE
jgi:hypothetical protein